MGEMNSVVYLNGSFVPEADAHLSILDRGFTLADGLFETMVASDDRIFRLDDHLDRLQLGADVLYIHLPQTEELVNAIQETLLRTGLPHSVARLTVTRGIDPGRGLDVTPGIAPSVMVRVTPWIGPLDSLPQGRRLALSHIRRNDLSPLAAVKSLSYVEGVVARLDAQRSAADDALMCNTRGFLTGATSSNVFAVIGGELVTPSEGDGALPGIARRTVFEEAVRLGILVRELSLMPEGVAVADEVFLTNVVTGVVPVVSLFGTAVGSGLPGPVTEQLGEAYWNRVVVELS
jgi:branched-chain amino acid aminotransferase